MFSFDVFDTALCRLVHSSEHVYLNVGRKLRARGAIRLGDIEWMYARQQAEIQQRLTVSHREVTLLEIHGRLARTLNLGPDVARVALETELAEEYRLTRPVAATQQQVTALVDEGISPVFLSDTYFTSEEVTNLLARVGYHHPVDVIVSCEELNSKVAGTLFQHVATQRGVANSDFRHIGDNQLSDVIQAAASGWQAELFTDSHQSTRERVISASGRGGFLASAVAGSARAARLGQVAPVDKGIASAAATVVGPLFSAYVLWVLRDVVARGGRKIHFLARDGQVLTPLCRVLGQWLGVEVEAIYTFASRQAFLLAALPEDDREMVNRALMLAYRDRTSVFGALASLKYSTEEIESITRQARVAPSVRRFEADEGLLMALRDALLQPEPVALLRSRAKTAREATLAYLESVGLFDCPDAYIVDLGWRGTIQLSLQNAVRNRVNLVGYYVGLYNTVLPSDAQTCVWLPSTKMKAGLLEVMASADHTSVRGFGFDESGTPVCAPSISEDPDLVEWGARQQQDIAVRFVEYFTQAVELEYYSVNEVHAALESAALTSYRHFQLSPTYEEAEAYGGFLGSEDINHGKRRQIAPPMSSKDALTQVFSRMSRGEVTSWYMGSLARSRGSRLSTLISTSIDRAIVLSARFWTRRRRRSAQRSARNSLGR